MMLYIAVTITTVLAACFVCGRREITGGNGGVCRQPEGISAGVMSRRHMVNSLALVFIFLVLFMLSALRFGMGDYWKYVEFMHLIRCDSYVPTEWGFNLLTKIIYGLSGFENYKLIFAVYSFLTVLIFMMAMYDQSADFKLTLFMFMTLGLYFQSFCTMRYYLALAIALYSIKFLKNRQWVLFTAVILLASGFHKSVIVVIPLYLLAVIPWKKWMIAVFTVFAASLVICRGFWMNVAVTLYPTYKETSYASAGGTISPVNIARCVAVLLFTLYVVKRTGNKKLLGSFMSKLNIMALVVYACCWYIPFVSRIGYYMTVTQILFVPELIAALAGAAENVTEQAEADQAAAAIGRKKPAANKIRRRAVILVGTVCVLYFAMYLKKAYSSDVNVLPYKTYLFEDSTQIVQDIS